VTTRPATKVSQVEIGAGWSRHSAKGRNYLSIKVDDPSFAIPMDADYFDDADGETAILIRIRSRTASCD
jgi:uncharacterized protein (DUF736 family)